MLGEIFRAFSMVFIAEMGDKTQIIAMTFATQYLVKDVLFGVFLGVLANHGLAIILGSFLSRTIPIELIQCLAGFMFIIFAFMSLQDDELDEFKESKLISPVTTVALAFFIGELGDKTQLTAMTLSMESISPILILVGTTLAMLATSSLGIFVGMKIGDKIPELSVKIVSSLVFIILGSYKVISFFPNTYASSFNQLSFLGVVLMIELLLVYRLVAKKRGEGRFSQYKLAAEKIYRHMELLRRTLDSICLGESQCGKCQEARCLIGYIKFILEDSRKNKEFYRRYKLNFKKLTNKAYDKDEVFKGLMLIVNENNINGWFEDPRFFINEIRQGLEFILVGQSIKHVRNTEDYIKKMKKIDKKICKNIYNYIKDSEVQYKGLVKPIS